MEKPSLQEIKTRLTTLLRCLNPDYPGDITPATLLRDDLGYDEIGLRALTTHLGKEFGYNFNPDLMAEVTSVEGLASLIDYYWPSQEE